MPTDITVNLHLGDNAHHSFPEAKFAGLVADLPIVIRNPTVENPTLIIHTSAIETHAEWQAHKVQLDGTLIGLLKDAGGQPNEVHNFDIPSALLGDQTRHRLSIEVGAAMPGLIDDFVLRALAIEGADLHFGWA